MTATIYTPIRALATVLAIAAFVVTGCKKDEPEAPAGGGFAWPPTSVTLGKLNRGPIVEYASLMGAARWPQRTVLKSELTGPVTMVALREGEHFKKGDVLVTVDVRDYEIRVVQAQAELLRAEMQLAQAKLGTRQEIIDRIAAEKPQLEVRLGLAKTELERTQRLFAEEVRTQADLDMAQATYAQIQAELVHLEARLAEAQAPPLAEDIAVAAANVEALRVAVDAAQRDVEKANIVAPYDGVLIAKSVETGGYVRAGDPLLEIVADGHLEVIVEAPETLIGELVPGVSFDAQADALPGRTLTCTVQAIIPVADPQTRNFRLRAKVTGHDGQLLEGMFIRATVPVASREDTMLAPLDAIVLQGNKQVIWVVQTGEAGMTANPVPVTLGLTSGDTVEVIAEGLKDGDTVVTTGGEVLRPGGAIMDLSGGGPGGPGGPPQAGGAPDDAAPAPDEDGGDASQ